MATWGVSDARTAVLRVLGVLGQGQAATSEDAGIVDDAIATAHAQLRKLGHAPWETTAIPDWSQDSFRDFVASKLAIIYGHSGQTLMEIRAAGVAGELELARQVARRRPGRRVQVQNY